MNTHIHLHKYVYINIGNGKGSQDRHKGLRDNIDRSARNNLVGMNLSEIGSYASDDQGNDENIYFLYKQTL
jgi:hypothetical protein